MPVYDYSCTACGEAEDFLASMHAELPDHLRCDCGGMMRRRFHPPAFHRFSEHFNTSLGQPVSSKRGFKTALYEAQEKATERLGFQQHFREAEPKERNEEGMKDTHDIRKAAGLST